MSYTLTHPMVMADILGASVFLILAIVFVIQGLDHKNAAIEPNPKMAASQIFTAMFATLSIVVALVIRN